MKDLNIKRLQNAKTHIEVEIAELELLAKKNKGVDWRMVASANEYIEVLQKILSVDNEKEGIESIINHISRI